MPFHLRIDVLIIHCRILFMDNSTGPFHLQSLTNGLEPASSHPFSIILIPEPNVVDFRREVGYTQDWSPVYDRGTSRPIPLDWSTGLDQTFCHKQSRVMICFFSESQFMTCSISCHLFSRSLRVTLGPGLFANQSHITNNYSYSHSHLWTI